ncbi:tripartite tricarboxylate transporter TctB family protein [Jonesiaceae bacterium BS-20]|uniref:Tripartite tricarboxylate transporter TctB family protein n=1 Tax=Jonesiaceae bacterium BS-20 TaxID=3120821 RepID=A0AAU7DS84_9MICO
MKNLTTKFPQFLIGSSFLIVAVAAFMGALAIDDEASPGDPGPASYPIFVIGLIFVCAALLTISQNKAQAETDQKLRPNKQLVMLVVSLGAYIALLVPLGYLLSTYVFTGVVLRIAGERRPLVIAIYAFGIPSVIFYVFTSFLGVSLPSGVLESLL